MTTQEWIRQQEAKIQQLKQGKQIAIAAQDTHVKMVERIFENGETSKGNKLSYNKSDPLYVNPDPSKGHSPKTFPPKGKNGDTKFKNGKDHQTGYFKSYKEFREKIGRETGFMNLNLFGNLQNDFGKGVVKQDNDSYTSTVTNEANKGKLDKFQVYFKLTKEEKENFKEVLHFETMRILR